MKLFAAALEFSANLHLKNLLKELENNNFSFELYGIFDEKVLDNKAYKSNINPEIFRIMGFLSALKLIPLFLKTKKELAKIALNCDIAIFMDSSSFNMPLIKEIRKLQAKENNKKTKIIYYILPQVWAWKKYRAKILAQICDALYGILPFEKDFYPNGTNIEYVGHPLLDMLSFSFKERQNTNKIAFMPGSRKAEIKALFPIFKELAIKLKKKGKEALLVIPNTFKDRNLNEIYGDVSDFSLKFNTQEALSVSEFAFVCSGTATLESTLFGIPTILVFKCRSLDFAIAKMLVDVRFIGLANLMLDFKDGDFSKEPVVPIHPEFLQKEVNVENLEKAYLEYDFNKFFSQKEKLLAYLEHGSAKTCAKNLENLAKNLQK